MVEKHACSYDFCDVFTGILELAFTAEFDNLHMIFYFFSERHLKEMKNLGSSSSSRPTYSVSCLTLLISIYQQI